MKVEALACLVTLQTPWVLVRSDAIKKQRRNVTSAASEKTNTHKKWELNLRSNKKKDRTISHMMTPKKVFQSKRGEIPGTVW